MNRLIDPGHSWFKVSIQRLIKLGIAHQISAYSYRRGDWAYLEEDCDAAVLFEAVQRATGKPPAYRNRFSDKQSRVRNYPSYYITHAEMAQIAGEPA